MYTIHYNNNIYTIYLFIQNISQFLLKNYLYIQLRKLHETKLTDVSNALARNRVFK